MMSKGFITEASYADPGEIAETTDIHVEDISETAPIDDLTQVITIYVQANSGNLLFTRPQAQAFVEAMQEILSRYPEGE